MRDNTLKVFPALKGADVSALSITLINLIARGCHLLLFLSIGNRFGTDTTTDTVFLLQAPLLVLMAVTAGAAEAVVMPAMHRAYRSNCSRLLLRVLTRRALLLVVPIALAISVFALQFVKGATPGLACLLVPMPVLASLSAIKVGVLNAEGKHRLALLGPLYGGLLSLPVLYLIPRSGYSLAIVLLLFELGRAGGLWLHKVSRHLESNLDVREVGDLISWATRGARLQAIGSFLMALNPFVDVLFANLTGIGAVTKVEYANRLWNIVPLLLSGQLIIAYAHMSRTASRSRLDYKQVHRKAVTLGLAAVGVSLVVIASSDFIIDLLYGFGKMNESARMKLADLLVCYLVGTGPFLGGLVYVRALSSEGRIAVITGIAAIGVMVNIGSNAVLIKFFGLNGIGLATSLTYGINTLLLGYAFSAHFVSRRGK